MVQSRASKVSSRAQTATRVERSISWCSQYCHECQACQAGHMATRVERLILRCSQRVKNIRSVKQGRWRLEWRGRPRRTRPTICCKFTCRWMNRRLPRHAHVAGVLSYARARGYTCNEVLLGLTSTVDYIPRYVAYVQFVGTRGRFAW